MPKISVIVPVYNRENLISRCINSILAQTFSDFELILIDDGSSDNSFEICKGFEKKDNRIKVLRKSNGGVSSARNLGLEHTTGSFIMFCDSDDFVEPQWIENLYRPVSDKAMLAICTYCGIEDEIIPYGEKFVYKLSDMWDIIKNGYLHVPWNKIYNAEIIKQNNLRFNEKFSYAEDMLFNLDYIEKLQMGEIVVDATPTYRQSVTVNSLSRKKHIDKYWEAISQVYDKIDLLFKMFNINQADIQEEYLQMYLVSMLRAVDNVFTGKAKLKEKYNKIKDILCADRSVLALHTGYSESIISPKYHNILKNKKFLVLFVYKFSSQVKQNILNLKISSSKNKGN